MNPAANLAEAQRRAKQRIYPRNCPHRGEQVGWLPFSPTQKLRMWQCRKYGKSVTWIACRDMDAKAKCSGQGNG